MATVILIVFLVALAALGKWWLNREKRKQRRKLESDVKIAQGKIDEVPVEDAKIERVVKWPDIGTRKEPPQTEVPSALMMREWTAQAADAVDKLLQAIHAYKQAQTTEAGLKHERSTAESRFDYNFPPTSPDSAEEITHWLEQLGDCRTRHDLLTERYQAAQVESSRLMEAAKQAMVDAWYCCEVARRWDLSKADDAFLDAAEMTAMVVDQYDSTFRPPRDMEHYYQLRPQGRQRRQNFAAKTQGSNQATSPAGQAQVDPADSFCEPEEHGSADYDKALAAARAALEKTFPLVVALHAASEQVQICATPLKEGQPVLTRLNKPAVSSEIEYMLEQSLNWAKQRQAEELAAVAAADVLREAARALRLPMRLAMKLCKAELGQDNLDQEHEGDKKQVTPSAKTARPPSEAQLAVRTTLIAAVDRLNSQTEHLLERSQNTLGLRLAFTPGAAENQAVGDACNQLRKLMRRVIAATAQTDAAQIALWSASRHSPALLTVPAPELTQSSLSAFINTHARMVEMTDRNGEKTRLHNQRLDGMKEHLHSRQAEEKETLKHLAEALPEFRSKAKVCGASLACMVAAAEVVLASYSEKKKK